MRRPRGARAPRGAPAGSARAARAASARAPRSGRRASGCARRRSGGVALIAGSISVSSRGGASPSCHASKNSSDLRRAPARPASGRVRRSSPSPVLHRHHRGRELARVEAGAGPRSAASRSSAATNGSIARACSSAKRARCSGWRSTCAQNSKKTASQPSSRSRRGGGRGDLLADRGVDVGGLRRARAAPRRTRSTRALVDGEEQVLLGGEVRVDRALGEAGLVGDGVERGGVVAVGAEAALGDGDQAPPASGAGGPRGSGQFAYREYSTYRRYRVKRSVGFPAT